LARNPNSAEKVVHKVLLKLMESIKENNKAIDAIMNEIEVILQKKEY